MQGRKGIDLMPTLVRPNLAFTPDELNWVTNDVNRGMNLVRATGIVLFWRRPD